MTRKSPNCQNRVCLKLESSYGAMPDLFFNCGGDRAREVLRLTFQHKRAYQTQSQLQVDHTGHGLLFC